MFQSSSELAFRLSNLAEPIPVRNLSFSSSDKRALGLDLGLHLGFAYALFSEAEKTWYMFPQGIGVVDLAPNRYETGFTCFLRLQEILNIVNPAVIFYELVKFTPMFEADVSPQAVVARVATSIELLGALRQTVLLWATDHGVPTIGIPIQVIKKTATGSGKANKKDIIEACNKMFKTDLSVDLAGADDAADAAFVLYSGLLNYGCPSFEQKIES